MEKKLNIVPLSELNLTSRFLYDEVMEDPKAHQAALSIVLGREIPLLSRSESEPDCMLGDGATRIFLNTRGKNDGEVSEELRAFLHYIENTTDEAAADTDSEHIRIIHEQVRKVKTSEEVGVRYMQAWEERYYDKQEAREEGLAEGREVGLKEGREEGLKEGREVGQVLTLIRLTVKKLLKGKTPETIADELETELPVIEKICSAAGDFSPEYDIAKIYELLKQQNE